MIHHYFKTDIINLIFHSLFATLKFYYYKRKENMIDKNYVSYKFFNETIYNLYQNMTDYLSNEFDYIIEVLIKILFNNENLIVIA